MKTALLDNRYRILETLGRGGFGQTFLAVDTHMPSGRRCVIKQLQPADPNPGMQEWVQERFQREAAILERLGEQHSQIPRLYAYFSEGENFFLVQEWIEGVTLRKKQQQEGVLSLEKVKEILVSILPVLNYIHEQCIIHRDIKPDNIILRASDNKPVLIDFGAVKEAMGTLLNLDTQRSPVSVAIGTPGYMSCEQAAGRPVYSSDLYSLGLTAIYLLTAKAPQELKIDSSTGEILWEQELNERIDPNLAEVIDRAIRFHPRDRFRSASEMLAALQPNAPSLTTATVVVAPKNSPIKGIYQPTTKGESRTKVIDPNPVKENNWLKLLLPMILIGGIGWGSFALSFNLLSRKQQARNVSTSNNNSSEIISIPDSKEEKPTVTQELPNEEEILPEQSAENFPDINEQPKTEEIPDSVGSGEPPSIIVDTIPETSNSQTNSEPSQVKTLPQPVEVPAFGTGTEKNQIIGKLGQPTSDRKGVWPNSRAMLYKDYIPNQVDLGYIYDSNTDRLRQTEVSFARSVSIEAMEKSLNNLLGSNLTPAEKEALQQVYQRETDLRSFDKGNLNVIIQLNDRNRIYIGIWEKDFH